MRGGNAVRHGDGAVVGDGLEEMMAELSERKEVSGGRAILGWDVAVDRAAWLRFRYAFWGGFAAWALLHLSPLDGSRHMPATFGEAMWLVVTAVLAGLAAAGLVGLVAVARKDSAWLRDYYMETFSVTEKAAPPEPLPVPQPRNGDNRPVVMVPSGRQFLVQHNRDKFYFQAKQIGAMLTRLESQDPFVTRDLLGVSGSAYSEVRSIMSALGYWGEEKGRYYWTDEGEEWLKNQTVGLPV
jgi:hypothetical protein